MGSEASWVVVHVHPGVQVRRAENEKGDMEGIRWRDFAGKIGPALLTAPKPVLPTIPCQGGIRTTEDAELITKIEDATVHAIVLA